MKKSLSIMHIVLYTANAFLHTARGVVIPHIRWALTIIIDG